MPGHSVGKVQEDLIGRLDVSGRISRLDADALQKLSKLVLAASGGVRQLDVHISQALCELLGVHACGLGHGLPSLQLLDCYAGLITHLFELDRRLGCRQGCCPHAGSCAGESGETGHRKARTFRQRLEAASHVATGHSHLALHLLECGAHPVDKREDRF